MSARRGLAVHVTSLAVTVRTLLHAQLCALMDDGWDVAVVTSPEESVPGPETAPQPEPPYRWLHEELPRTLSPGKDTQIFRRLRRLFRELRPTVVHTHSVKVALPALAAAASARIPRRFHTVHGFYHLKTVRPIERQLARWWEARVLHLAHTAAFVSRFELTYSQAWLAPRGELFWLGNGVDLAHFRPPSVEERCAARQALGIPSAALVLSTVARFAHEKRLDRTLAVFRALAKQRDDVHLIIGGGALSGDRHVQALDLAGCPPKRIHRPGWVSDVRPILHASDLFLLLSQGEGRSTAAMEAAATGLPLILSHMPASHDLVDDGRSGHLVDANDPEAVARLVLRLTEDPELRDWQRRSARSIAEERFDQRDVDRRLTQLYQRSTVRRRRVLHVINSFYPLVGGAERQAAALAHRQMDAGDLVTVLTRRQRGMAAIGGGSLAVRRVGWWWLGGPGFLAAAAAWILPRRRQFDVIHAHQAYWPAVIAALVRQCGGPPALVKLAGPDLPRDAGPFTRLRRLAACRLDAVVATQPAMATAAKAIGLQRVAMIPNGVDSAEFAPDTQRNVMAAAQGGPPSEQVVLYVGRLERIKGIDLLLAAWPQVIRGCPRARLRIAGEGALGAALRRAMPAGIEFLGEIGDPRSLYQMADVFVLPSRYEGFSNALLEAMASGLAVVATAVGGNAEVIRDGVNGLLVPAEEPAALASAILTLTAEPERRHALGEAARATVLQCYRLEAVEKQWDELYARLGTRPIQSRHAR